MESKSIVNDAILKDIGEKIHGIAFGTVIITIYNSRIVQVDVTSSQKKRFDDVWLIEDGAGI